ncbi:MAG: hypothetical protein HEEMFOPI_01762 [Holosporales bacterium]
MENEIINQAFDIIENFNLVVCNNNYIKIESIEQGENFLSIHFPNSYKIFLKKYGYLTMFGREIYGIIDNNFLNSGIPDVIWLNHNFRKKFDLPHHIISISDIGDGSYYALDLSQMNEEQECPVVIWPVGGYEETPELEIVAPDFGTWFYDQVMQQIEIQKKKN